LGAFLFWRQEAQRKADSERAKSALQTPIDTPQFHVSAHDRQTYPVDVSGNFLSFIPKPGSLNPDGSKILPSMVWVRSGPMDGAYASSGQNSFCNGSIADDIRHNYPDVGKFHSFEQSMIAPVKAPVDSYRYFVSADKNWVARCWDERTCITLFSTRTWTARLDIAWQDLCKVPGMYARLNPIVGRWVK
jgi:hypothetical protein